MTKLDISIEISNYRHVDGYINEISISTNISIDQTKYNNYLNQ